MDQPPEPLASTSTPATWCTSSSIRWPSSRRLPERIFHVHVKDARVQLDGRNSILGVPPGLRRSAAGLELRVPRTRRRGMGSDRAGAQPHRLWRAPVDRMGGLAGWTVSGVPKRRYRWCADNDFDAVGQLRSTRPSETTNGRPGVHQDGCRGIGAESGEDVPHVGVGMLGYAFMGKAHSNAMKKIPYMVWPPPAVPDLVPPSAVATSSAVAEAAQTIRLRLATTTHWRRLGRGRSHARCSTTAAPTTFTRNPCIAAAEAGKHLLCEKPLGRVPPRSRRRCSTPRRQRA